MTNMSGVIQQLKKERVRLEDQLHRVTAALTAFGRVAQKARWAKQKATPKRTIRAAGRKRIAAAQRARWAKMKSAGTIVE
jgi:predicted anti-sigma-YlaC factor YlaD